MSRSLEDLDTLLGMAKIDANTLTSCVQSLSTSSSLCSDNILLFELDPLAASALRGGQSLVIRGKINDVAACCSFDKTFEVKESETSNSLLLFRNNLFELSSLEKDIYPREVECLKRNFYELKPARPSTKWLKEKLESHPYDGTTSQNFDLCTFEDLLDVNGTSEKELIDVLNKCGACLIEGFWRIIDFDYLCRLFRDLLAIVDEAGWSYSSIPTQQLKDALSELFILEVVNHLLSLYTLPLDTGFCCLNEHNVCRLYAEMILRAAIKFDLADFKQTWQLSVPDGLNTSFEQIKDLAILDLDSKPETISYFPVLGLPDDIKERFKAIFIAKEKWTFEEITPYLQDLCSGPQEVTKLLLKYTRMSTLKDVRVYSRRL